LSHRMGCVNQNEEAKVSRRIDNEMKEKKNKPLPTFLFLGIGGSGKSTFFKVLEYHTKEGFSSTDASILTVALRTTTLDYMKTILRYVFGDTCEDKDVQNILSATLLDSDLASSIQSLLETDEIQEFLRKNVYELPLHLPDSYHYCLQNCQRFIDDDYKLSIKDAVHAYYRTSGMKDVILPFPDHKVRCIDVGGQRPEQKRWLWYLEGVTAIIFIAALNDYVKCLEEDEGTNRLVESIKVFDQLTHNPKLKDHFWILLLNKKDLLKDLIQNNYLVTRLYPNYKGETNYCESKRLIRQKFMEVYGGREPLICRFTCAVDIAEVKCVFEELRKYIFTKALQHADQML